MMVERYHGILVPACPHPISPRTQGSGRAGSCFVLYDSRSHPRSYDRAPAARACPTDSDHRAGWGDAGAMG
ncbi:hypothetical protein B0H17DRAFT_1093582 [Mycena rosella]|uniref:Uncharacterized protein n=1 Tax=Mycena rosella TaxID=1033263 RepID=A0AAD7G6S3_MYCRO|nr:hypothetical protein B0H17DRAFT_1093582 [Mycena rosella]